LIAEVSARRRIPEGSVRTDALGWIAEWWSAPIAASAEPIPASVGLLVGEDAGRYAIWQRIGPSTGSQPGFLALHALAIREARGSVERGTEAASDTYLDVRDRLERFVERALKGRSLPDFTKPGPIGEDNVHRYHAIQARLRLKGKWTKRRAEEAYDDARHASEWKQAVGAAEARTYALPLHFAAWWTLLDSRVRTTRDGRVKDQGWWWEMLLHALDVRKLGSLGGDRNDPTEALLRLRLRFAVSQGLAGWLRRRAHQVPSWRQVQFGLPDPDNAPAREAMVEALATVRPALGAALEGLDATDAERDALRRTLIRGDNVRTSTRGVSGADANERHARLFALGEDLGRAASDRLDGGGGGGQHTGGGGGGGEHQHVDALMARLATGASPSRDEVASLKGAMHACEDCRDRWVGLVEADSYLTAAAATPGRAGTRRVWVAAGVVLAAAVALLVVLPEPGGDQQVLLRGAASTPPVHLDLFVAPEAGSEVERFDAARDYARGDHVYFQIAADADAAVRVWVEGPEGTDLIGVQDAGVAPARLGREGASAWYRLDQAGRYSFYASSALTPGEDCAPPTCVRRVVEVVD